MMSTSVAIATPSRPHPLSIATPALKPPTSNQPLFSPVNEAGIFELHRVLKSGQLSKRRKRTNKWDTVYLVLRPNVLSIYTDPHETQLKHQINLSEVSAVAIRKDRKRKDHKGVFGIFSPARNFHLEAESEAEAQTWVELVRKEARIGGQNQDMVVTSPGGTKSSFIGFGHMGSSPGTGDQDRVRRFRASSEISEAFSSSREGSWAPPPRFSHDNSDPSGSEVGSYPDLPETPMFGSLRDLSINSRHAGYGTRSANIENIDFAVSQESKDRSNFYKVGQTTDEERVIWHGYLECLKSQSAVRQWKKYWVVLRTKNIGFYKSDEEYAALLILPLSSIIGAVETDPVSKTKDHCMQVITEDRSYRFSCSDEEDLTRWLAALKSTLAKKKDGRV